jgi:hypothetical protein
VKIPDPDPGKKCGSDRIRILNTAKERSKRKGIKRKQKIKQSNLIAQGAKIKAISVGEE